MKKILLFIFIMICASLVSCATVDPPTEKEVAHVNIENPNVTLFVGQTYNATATVSPLDAVNAEVMWSSSNSSICTAHPDGALEATGAGSCIVKAYCSNGVYSNVTVTVLDLERIRSVYLSESTLMMTEGQTFDLDAFSNPISSVGDPPVIWSSTDEQIATVDENGIVKAVSVGSCRIEAICDSRLRAVCAISVLEAEDDIPVFDLSDLVEVEVLDLPQELVYRDSETGEIITSVSIDSYEIELAFYDKSVDGIKVTVRMNGTKTYDCDGDTAENCIAIIMNLLGAEKNLLDRWLLSIEAEEQDGEESAVAGKIVGDEISFVFEFEAKIAMEKRHFYITLSDSESDNFEDPDIQKGWLIP